MGSTQGREGPDPARCLALDLDGLRLAAGLSFRELARRTGCPTSTLSDALRGRRFPRLDTVLAVARACGEQADEWRVRWVQAERHRSSPDAISPDAVRGDTIDRPVAPPRPAQLPADVAAFVGRDAELYELDRLVATVDRSAGSVVVISAVSGTAGVGKTALAVRWAHRVAGRFPDGQLYVDLRGYDPAQPMPTDEALALFLRALSGGGHGLPGEVSELAAQYRSRLDGRRMLIVVDNAASAEQVRPLVPGSGSCMVVVTSRDRLAGLVARDGARRLDLDVLPPPDASRLLRKLIGVRVDAEPEAAAQLAELCARLPLAVRIAAELVAARPRASLAELCAELRGQRRLDLFDAGGDPRTALRSVFSWSYRHLPAAAAGAFRLLGLHPGRDFDAYAVAALAGTDLGQAQRLLEMLGQAQLVGETAPARYALHDLLRVYAHEQATSHDTEGERRAALTRLFAYQTDTASEATWRYACYEYQRRHGGREPRTPAPQLTDLASALRWLDTERANLVATAGYASDHGWPDVTTHLSATLFRYLETGGHYLDAEHVHSHALRTADRCSAGIALRGLGAVYWRWARYPLALRHYQQALTIARETDDRDSEGRALRSLGLVHDDLAQYPEALDHYQKALTIARETGDRVSEGRTLCHLGIVHHQQGRYRQALDHHQHALAIARETGNRVGEGRALGNLGFACHVLGRYQEALDHHRHALAIASEIGNRGSQSIALGNLGLVYERTGRPQDALQLCEQALAIADEIGDRGREGIALGNLGLVCHRLGRYQQALEHHQRALDIARETGARQQQVAALNGAGQAHIGLGSPTEALECHRAAADLAHTLGDRLELAHAHAAVASVLHAAADQTAITHWRRALLLYAELDVPEAGELRATLACLDHAGPKDQRQTARHQP